MAGWKNTTTGYGRVSVLLHWLSALTVFSLFGLGLYMVELGYYDPLYKQAPSWHKSIGLILLGVTIFRLFWKLTGEKPKSLSAHSKWTVRLSKLGHHALYLLLLSLMVSGYLISTADGRAIDVFGWFEVPAIISGIKHQEDIAGIVHFYLAWSLVSLASGHGLMAVKHHVVDKDNTLKRMLTTSNRD